MNIKTKKILIFIALILASGAIGVILGVVTSRKPEPVAPVETAETAPPETPAAMTPVRETDWRLTLVNPWNPITDRDAPILKKLDNDQAVDERCYPDLVAMMAACEAAGNNAFVCSSYRTQERQQTLFENKLQRLLDEGVDPAIAPQEAGKVVALPGTSEHQLGLAVDIMDESYPYLDAGQADTDAQKWLMAHSWEYGFILRYPESKSEITGIIYEPWHYRYVGQEAAKEIFEQGICLEEYLNDRK